MPLTRRQHAPPLTQTKNVSRLWDPHWHEQRGIQGLPSQVDRALATSLSVRHREMPQPEARVGSTSWKSALLIEHDSGEAPIRAVPLPRSFGGNKRSSGEQIANSTTATAALLESSATGRRRLEQHPDFLKDTGNDPFSPRAALAYVLQLRLAKL